MDRKARNYSELWKTGNFLSFIVYYSGILFLCRFIMMKILKKHHGVILAYHQVQGSPEDALFFVDQESSENRNIFWFEW